MLSDSLLFNSLLSDCSISQWHSKICSLNQPVTFTLLSLVWLQTELNSTQYYCHYQNTRKSFWSNFRFRDKCSLTYYWQKEKSFCYFEAWNVHPGIRIEGNHLTCEDVTRCPECSPGEDHWPGARYLTRFTKEFPHFEVSNDNLGHKGIIDKVLSLFETSNNKLRVTNKWPRKMSKLGGCLRQVVAYKSLVSIWQLQIISSCFKCLITWKVRFERKSVTSHRERFVSCTTQECNNVTTPYYPSNLWSTICQIVLYGRLTKKFQNFNSKSGRSHLREVVA